MEASRQLGLNVSGIISCCNCHLKYKTHSKGFWNIIEKYCPNYKKYEHELEGIKI